MSALILKPKARMKPLKKILIANRGEIACRIIRSLKNMHITAVAVYSDADRYAQHVKQADEAYYLGASPAKESYLNAEKILAIAKLHQVDAIHPGYGFLSENADFAKACAEAGIVFIGPPVTAIQQMGNKGAAKALMVANQVPTLPGYFEKNQDENVLLSAAKKIGFPVLIKASYGGGGRGMRIVENEAEWSAALSSAQREALNSFGNSEVIVEKYLVEPRHVEVQIFADQSGNTVYLFERDCSIQRRHQKVIEEAPAPGISDSLRQQLGEAAVRAAKAIHYVGAGTIEFLLAKDQQFYFMEMNTRLQVEHPVTEKIINEDLVAWQIKVAQGARLPKLQSEIKKNGAAIEVRLCAEDPYHDFLPASGKIECFDYPNALVDVRVDTGYASGDEVTMYYDSMLAKIIAWGADRESARRLLLSALAKTNVSGVKTNRAVLSQILQQKDFIDAKLSTHFIAHHEEKILAIAPMEPVLLVTTALYLLNEMNHQDAQTQEPWKRLSGFRLYQDPSFTFLLHDEHHRYEITCIPAKQNGIEQKSNLGKTGDGGVASPLTRSVSGVLQRRDSFDPDATFLFNTAYIVSKKEHSFQIAIDEAVIDIEIWRQNDVFMLHWQNQSYQLHLDSRFGYTADNASSENQLTAPMPGRIVSCTVKLNDTIKAGEALLIMEAMKMEHTIRAPYDGVVTALHCVIGEMVSEGAQLIEMEKVE